MSLVNNLFEDNSEGHAKAAALVEAMVGAAAADGEISSTELAVLQQRVDGHPIFSQLDPAIRSQLVQAANARLAHSPNPSDMARGLGMRLRTNPERISAYALACEVIASDREVKEQEQTYLRVLQHALQLPTSIATEIFSKEQKNSSAEVISEQFTRLQTALPQAIDAMAVIAHADGAVDDREIDLIVKIALKIADPASANPGEMRKRVTASIARVADQDVSTVIKSLAHSTTNSDDRYWFLLYMMLVALADDVKDWNEIDIVTQTATEFGIGFAVMSEAWQAAQQMKQSMGV